MARKPRMAIELLSDIGSKAYDLQVYTEPEIQAALAVMRRVNAPLFDWLTQLLVAAQERGTTETTKDEKRKYPDRLSEEISGNHD